MASDLEDLLDYGGNITWISYNSICEDIGHDYRVTEWEWTGDDIEGYTSSMIALTFVASLFVYTICILVNILIPSLFQLNTAFLLFMWIQTFTNAAITFWLMRKRFVYDYKKVIAYTFLNAILSPAIAIVAILLFPKYPAYAKVVGAGVSGIFIGLYFTIYWCVKGRKFFNKQYWGYALKFNLPLIPHYLSSDLLHSSDKLMINSMIGSASAGIYGISHSITGFISIVTQAINHSLIPYTLQSIKSGNYKGLKKTVTACLSIVSVVCLCVMMFAKEGVLIFATEEYIEAVNFMPALTLAVLFSFMYGVVGNIMFYYEKTWQMSVITISIAIVNIATNYFGIKWFGYITAGYTTLICSFLQFTLYYLVVSKYEKNLNQIVDLRWFALIILVYVGFAIYAIIFYNYFLLRLAFVLVMLTVVFLFRKKIMALFSSMKVKDKEQTETENQTDKVESNE